MATKFMWYFLMYINKMVNKLSGIKLLNNIIRYVFTIIQLMSSPLILGAGIPGPRSCCTGVVGRDRHHWTVAALHRAPCHCPRCGPPRPQPLPYCCRCCLHSLGDSFFVSIVTVEYHVFYIFGQLSTIF